MKKINEVTGTVNHKPTSDIRHLLVFYKDDQVCFAVDQNGAFFGIYGKKETGIIDNASYQEIFDFLKTKVERPDFKNTIYQISIFLGTNNVSDDLVSKVSSYASNYEFEFE